MLVFMSNEKVTVLCSNPPPPHSNNDEIEQSLYQKLFNHLDNSWDVKSLMIAVLPIKDPIYTVNTFTFIYMWMIRNFPFHFLCVSNPPISLVSTYLEWAHECFIHTHHRSCIVKLSTVVRSWKKSHQLSLGKEFVAILYHLWKFISCMMDLNCLNKLPQKLWCWKSGLIIALYLVIPPVN